MWTMELMQYQRDRLFLKIQLRELSTHLHKCYYSQQDQMYLGNLGTGIFSFQFSGSSFSFFSWLFCFVLFLPVLFPHSFFLFCFVLVFIQNISSWPKRSHEIKNKVIKPCLFHDSRKYAFWVLNLVLFLIPRHSNRLTSHPSAFFKITVNVLFTNYVIELNLKSKRLYWSLSIITTVKKISQ